MTEDPGVLIGTTGEGRERRKAAERLRGEHLLVTGATGTGKNIQTLSLTQQLASRSPLDPIWYVGPKFDFAESLVTFTEALVSRLPPPVAEQFLSHFVHVAPWRRPMELNVLAPTGEEPETLGMRVVDSMEAALDADLNFERMRPVLQLSCAAGSQTGLNMTQIPKVLTDATFRRQIIARLPSGYVKENLEARIRLTPSATIGAILARFDRLVFSSARVRRLLEGPGCFSFRDRTAIGTTIADLSGAPDRGQGLLVQGLVTGSLAAAPLARRVDARTRPLLIVIDEAPVLLGSRRFASELGSMLSLVRAHRVAIWLLAQDGEAQLHGTSSGLWSLVQTNCPTLLSFRGGSGSSMNWLAPFVPPPRLVGRRPLLDPPPSVTAEYTRRMVASLAGLPNRVCLYVDRSAGETGGELIATPTIDLDAVAREGAALPPSVRAIIRGEGAGAASVPPVPAPDAAPESPGSQKSHDAGPSREGERSDRPKQTVAREEKAEAGVPVTAPPRARATDRTPARFALGWWPLSAPPGAAP